MDAKLSDEDKYQAISFVSSGAPDAEAARLKLIARYGDVPIEQADVIVALGGDGLMLQTLHRTMIGAEAGLRHEPRLGRLPDERLFRARPARPPRGGACLRSSTRC